MPRKKPYRMIVFPELTPRESQAALLLGRGYSVCDAARSIRCDRSTIYYWLERRPEFVEAVEETKARFVRELERELAGEDRTALRVLREYLNDATTPPDVRVDAAKTILSLRRPAPPESDPQRLFRDRIRRLVDVEAA